MHRLRMMHLLLIPEQEVYQRTAVQDKSTDNWGAREVGGVSTARRLKEKSVVKPLAPTGVGCAKLAWLLLHPFWCHPLSGATALVSL